ncbi:MAG: hypothetical protein R2942_05285 [Ignavibacteria bacterium]
MTNISAGFMIRYFTPKDQLINSGLLSVNYTPSNLIKFGLNLNIGIYSTVKNPYLYLNTDSTGQIYVDKSYSKEKFYPATVNFFTNYQISDKMLLRIQYDYQKTNFYINNYFGISYILSFWNGKNKFKDLWRFKRSAGVDLIHKIYITDSYHRRYSQYSLFCRLVVQDRAHKISLAICNIKRDFLVEHGKTYTYLINCLSQDK